MKKLYTFILGLLVATMSFAQTDDVFVFVNTAGNVVPDGSTVTVTDYDQETFEWFNEIMMPSGLAVKNISEYDATVYRAGMKISITQIPNGKFQHCFPSQCETYYKPENVQREGVAAIKAGEDRDIQSEWYPTAYGTCTVKYTVQLYSYSTETKQSTYVRDLSSVTVNYVYADPASVNGVASAKVEGGQVYNLQGQPVSKDYRGLIIKDGKKFFVR